MYLWKGLKYTQGFQAGKKSTQGGKIVLRAEHKTAIKSMLAAMQTTNGNTQKHPLKFNLQVEEETPALLMSL